MLIIYMYITFKMVTTTNVAFQLLCVLADFNLRIHHITLVAKFLAISFLVSQVADEKKKR